MSKFFFVTVVSGLRKGITSSIGRLLKAHS